MIIKNYDLYGDGKERRLFIKEGSDFANSREKIVIIVHDAHNIFEEKYSSYNKSWNLNKKLEELGIFNYLIFGLECAPGLLRIKEYSPVENRKELAENEHFKDLFKTPIRGKEYIAALKEKLIPEMEKEFNFKLSESTSMMIGSSMGGIITTYAALVYPNWINTYLSFSCAFYANDPYMIDFVNEHKTIGRFYHDMGGREVSGAVDDEEKYYKGFMEMENFLLKSKSEHLCSFELNAEHNEIAWNKRLATALLWAIKK